ncbi:MAG: DNA polymerase III subunit gamma/tau [Ruminococcaceae bacterium]|nr:DNA polymerase III subunit gamma/tau [Oscillospiraceae bacterium]
MAYKALYRKWRPLIFDDVCGQEHITKTLKNEIIGNKTAHAYLFTGTRGTGKTSSAKIFARAINCTASTDGNPCNQCEVCKGILDETILDVVEMDAASNTGVDNIRQIIEQVQYVSTVAKYKVYIIDEVHMLSTGAFNALLKTLEEPPQGVVFILATTEVHKVPATILSRCQRFDFKTIGEEEISGRIKYILKEENISADDDAINYVSYLGNGSMRDALSILDQCLAFKDNNLTYEDVVSIVGAIDDKFIYNICSLIAQENVKEVIETFDSLIKEGKNTDNFTSSMMIALRNIMIAKCTDSEKVLGVGNKRSEEIRSVADKFSLEKLSHCIEVVNELANNIKFSSNVKVLTELALVRMTDPRFSDSKEALLARLSSLEKSISDGSLCIKTSTEETKEIKEKDVASVITENDHYEETTVAENDFIAKAQPETKNDSSVSLAEDIVLNKDEINGWMFANGHIEVCTALMGADFYTKNDEIYVCVESNENYVKLNQLNAKELISKAIEEKFGSSINVNITFDKGPEDNGEGIFSELKDLSKNFPNNFNIN